MNDVDKLLEKLKEEKLKEKEKILFEAEGEKKEILKKIEEEVDNYFGDLFEKEKNKLIAYKRESLFKRELEAKKEILEKKERMAQVALEKIKEFLEKNIHLVPEKEIITKEEKIKERVDIDEFLKFLKEKYNKEIRQILDEVGV